MPLLWPTLVMQCAAIAVAVVASIVYFRLVGRLAWALNSQLDAEANVAEDREEKAATH